MYRIPDDLDLTAVVGEFTTQVRVGQFDLGFAFGRVTFAVCSPVKLFRGGMVVAQWEVGRWPDSGFYEIMNTAVTRCGVLNNRLIVLEFDNGMSMHLEDSSDPYECMHIRFEGNPLLWVIWPALPGFGAMGTRGTRISPRLHRRAPTPYSPSGRRRIRLTSPRRCFAARRRC